MIKRLQKLLSYRQMLMSMVFRDLKAKYVGSILGISWAVITPLLIMLAITFVFTRVMRIDIENFPLFSLSAILPWIFFSTALSEAVPSIVNNVHLLNQFTIPVEALPISSVLGNFINFLFGLVAMLPVFIFFNIQILPFLLLLPLALFLHLIFTIGLSLFLSSLNVNFRDVTHLLGVGMMFWFWLTPVFYSLDMVPERFRWLCGLNPLTYYIIIYRNILFDARISSFSVISTAFLLAIAMFFIGYIFFIKVEPSFTKKR